MEIHIIEKPSLKNPILIAAWPGMGMLARMSADYLIQQLNAKLFAELHSPSNDIYFKDGVGTTGEYTHHFYYVTTKTSDLIVCVGEMQPQTQIEMEQLAHQILEFAKKFGIKRVCTFAAVPNPQAGVPQVFGVVNRAELLDFLKQRNIQPATGEGRITGLNGLLITVAEQLKMDGICLLGEIRYLDIPQPRSVQSVLNSLSQILEVGIDTTTFQQQAEEMEQKIEEIIERRMPPDTRSKEPRYIS
jgi:proteasome assembly chaperone (PAC2) family protein